MQSFEKQAPSSPMQQRPSGSLQVDIGSKGRAKLPSPPRTPIASQQARMGRGTAPAALSRALRMRTGPYETFLDDITPIDALRYHHPSHALRMERDSQDSHDLSLSPQQGTRDSLVDHMLLSFDQLQEGAPFGVPTPTQNHDDAQMGYRGVADEENYSSSYTTSRNGYVQSHGSSYSPDLDGGGDTTGRAAPLLNRNRRSNSSSNFQTGLARLNSMRSGANSSSSTLQRPSQTQSRVTHSRSGKSSKGSSAGSLDLGYSPATVNPRWAQGRSSSFDFGQDRQMLLRLDAGATTTFTPYDYDAAPTPTVPVGPRRQQPPLSPKPVYEAEMIPAPPIPTTLEHQRSTRSSKSAYQRPAEGLSMSFHHGANESTRELPALPAFVKEVAAPAPTVGYGKSKEGPPTSTAPPLSKPGFFRRVFGSARHHHAPALEPQLLRASTATESTDRPCSKPKPPHVATQIKGHHHHPPPQETPPAPKETPHVLTKRPSSFFRRRKKSISEPPSTAPPLPLSTFTPPPVPRSRSENDKLALKRPSSPVSSLRKVMTPYLKDAVRQPNEGLGDDAGEPFAPEQRGLEDLLQERAVTAKATIRAVKPGSRESGEEGTPAAHLAHPRSFLDADDPGLRFRTGSSGAGRSHVDPTFLQDSSDNDGEISKNLPPAPTTNGEAMGKGIARPARSAPAAPLVAPVHERRGVNPGLAVLAVHSGRSASNSSLASTPGSDASKMKPVSADKDEEWVMLTPTRSTSKEQLPLALNLSLPLEGPRIATRESGSTGTAYKSATSLVQTDDEEEPRSSPQLLTAAEGIKALDEVQVEHADAEEPTDEDRETAKKIYDGNEDGIQKSKAAAWLGEDGAPRRRALAAYMRLYDFANLNILAALRLLCGRLVLRAESQQVDRILDEFAKRWCACNPNHGFKALDVVHTICFSILLLNTDLHLADIDSKMTRSQFVKNTMPTILRVVTDAAPDAFDSRPSILPRSHDKDLLSPVFKPSEEQLAKEGDEKPSWRSSIRPAARTNSDDPPPTPLFYGSSVDDCGPLVKAPFYGTLRTWEVQVEIVLKDFYGSIRSERLPLFGAAPEKSAPQQQPQNNLSVFPAGVLRRSPSVLSKTPSENAAHPRGRTADPVRPATGRWTSKNRSRPRIYPNSAVGSSRTSLDDQSSMWSPSVSSSTWSKYSLGKTQTSMSVDSFGSSYPQADYQQSIGFANALSQAIIREESVAINGSSNGAEDLREAPLLEDESLELAGAPWAKEGIVKHKHHLEAVDKKAKDRNWNETFAVIEKGYMRLFSFSAKSMRNKSKSKAAGGVVGGGNWQDNAENLGSFLLRQTIASALPPPGYSKARPHVWALSLPNGAVHLFQVGTPEIVREFVSTANYWSARLSHHPLVGGISNIEYGWSEAIINNALVQAINDTTRPSTSGPRPSLQSSLRSSLDHGSGPFRARLPGDKIFVSDWMPPTQSMRASSLREQDQLRTLITYVQGIEEELQKHNQLRSSMSLAFTPRHHNAQRAMTNWEKKSSYLLREIVKFRTYIDCLQAAGGQKKKIYAEREAQKEAKEVEDEGDSTLRPE